MSLVNNSTRIALLSLFLLVSACSDSSNSKSLPEKTQKYQYEIPQLLADGWLVGHLDDQQIDSQQISLLAKSIINGEQPGIDSLTIVRNDTLVFHQNFRTELTQYDKWVGNDELERHVTHSTSKSFASALIGIAIDQGYVTDTSVPFYQFFDYPAYANWDPQKNKISLDNVLTMQMGLAWDEWTFPFGDSRNSLTSLTENNDDFVKALLDLPIDSVNGEQFTYNTIASVALGLVVEKTSGLPMEDFAQIYLFEPLQINQASWLMTPEGYPNAGSGLVLRSRDMAKLGQLYLDKGQWNGLQIISPQWIEKSLSKKAEINQDYTSGYGYQWWLGEFSAKDKNATVAQTIPFYSTRGYGGQFIIIIPQYEMVIAFTAHNYENGLYDSPFRLVEQFIIPAIQ